MYLRHAAPQDYKVQFAIPVSSPASASQKNLLQMSPEKSVFSMRIVLILIFSLKIPKRSHCIRALRSHRYICSSINFHAITFWSKMNIRASPEYDFNITIRVILKIGVFAFKGAYWRDHGKRIVQWGCVNRFDRAQPNSPVSIVINIARYISGQ